MREKEKEKQAMLRDKLKNNFIECAEQSGGVRHNDLEGNYNIMNSTLSISNIRVMDGSDCIGWIQGISTENKIDTLVVNHIAMDTKQTNKGLCKYIILGFSKAVKKQFPHINHIEFHQLMKRDIDSAKAGYYTSLFKKCKMVPDSLTNPKTPYTLIL